ncbi:MAG: hypothetical protein ABSG70_18475 [Terriglobales bacterium]|jgi:hypothetical protein
MDEQQQQRLAAQSVARLRQIHAKLADADKLEKESLAKLASSKENTPEGRKEIENAFTRMRVELYNEQAIATNYLLNFAGKMPATLKENEIVGFAKSAGLADNIKELHRQQAVTRDDCWTPCVTCVSVCYECVAATHSCIPSSMPY